MPPCETGPWAKMIEQIQKVWPPERFCQVGIVVGVSGGADSTALLVALAQCFQERGFQERGIQDSDLQQQGSRSEPPSAKGFLVAAHFNHGLRGEESDEDQRFVQSLAQQSGAAFISGRTQDRCHDEATMSAQRMQFLISTAKQQGARYIALAHSLDDNVETVLHHLMRGTGPAGLCGIGSPRNIDEDLVLIRPMLSIQRTTIRDALHQRGQTWREDSSNQSRDYSRNWIRHELIPLMESRYPDATDAIERAIQGQRGWRKTIDQMAADWIDHHRISEAPKDASAVIRQETVFRRNPQVDPAADIEADSAIVIAAMQIQWAQADWPRGSMTREHWLRLADTIRSTGDQRYSLPGGIHVVATDHEIRLNPKSASRG